METNVAVNWGIRSKIGLISGPALFFIIFFVPMDMPLMAQRCLGMAAWIGVWWVTEAVPLAITSLLPLILIPVLGLGSAQSAATPYANSNVMLFLGGFIIAQSIVAWNLHQRLALLIVNFIGTGPKKIILGFMAASALLSMWISNTAATVALMPIGLSVSYLVRENLKNNHMPESPHKSRYNFGIALMLAIAFGASIGGLATPIGSPPNLIFIGALQKLYPEMHITFLQWMLFGIPLATLLFFPAWLILVNVLKPGFRELIGGKEMIRSEISKLGSWSKAEKMVLMVFIVVVFLWITRSYLINPFISTAIDDSTIAIFGAVLLFVLPVSWQKGRFAMDWGAAKRIPWDVLLLFGGGLSLAGAISTSGLAEWMGDQMSVIRILPPLLITGIIVLFNSSLSEITSNTGTAAMMMPVMAALATAAGISPVATMLAAAIAVSFVYLLPVGTPPNAIIYSSGYIRVVDMVRGGILIKITHLIIGTFLIYYLAIPIFINTFN